MRNGLLGSVSALLAGTGLVLAQSPPSSPRPYTTPLTLPAPGQPSSPGQPATLPPAEAIPRLPTPSDKIPPATDKSSAKPDLGWPAVPPDQGCGCLDEPLCGMGGRVYGSLDFLYWWTKGDRLPPLVTTGNPGDLLTTGALGQPGTQVLFGNKEVNDDDRPGGRATVGFWVNKERSVGLEANLFILDRSTTNFSVNSADGTTVIARPYVNQNNLVAGLVPTVNVAAENALVVALPGSLTGNAVASTSNTLWGYEVNGRFNVGGCSNWRADALLGFRYLNVHDDLTVTSTSNPTDGGVVGILAPDSFGVPLRTVTGPPAALTVVDAFSTRNEYYGGQAGINLEYVRGQLSVGFLGKLALGVMRQSVNIQGATSLTTPGQAPIVATGGLLAQTTNIGVFSRNEFGIVPEAGINVGYQFGDHLRAFLGYSILYFRSDVVRPGTEIDRVVNPSLIPASSIGLSGAQTNPQFGFRNVDFWAQGLSAGVQISY
jgi:hypothetical protein